MDKLSNISREVRWSSLFRRHFLSQDNLVKTWWPWGAGMFATSLGPHDACFVAGANENKNSGYMVSLGWKILPGCWRNGDRTVIECWFNVIAVPAWWKEIWYNSGDGERQWWLPVIPTAIRRICSQNDHQHIMGNMVNIMFKLAGDHAQELLGDTL